MLGTDNHRDPYPKTWRGIVIGLVIFMAVQSITACAPLVIGAVAITSIDLSNERRTIGRNIDDNLLELKLRKDYRADDRLGSPVNISVTIVNGIVLLTGEVHTDEQRQYAESLAAQHEQTRKVVNELALSGRTSLNSRANDSYITAKVKSGLLRADGVPMSNIKVVTERGNVYLLGLVTQAEADAAVEAVKSVTGVTHVIKVFEYIKAK